MPVILSYDYIKSYFNSQGCVLLSTDYTNSKKNLDYICSCGNKSKIRFNNFKNQKNRCKKCGDKRKGHKYQYVKTYFKNQNCVLLSKSYSSVYQQLEYICSCGNKSIITFKNFQNGNRCRKCGETKRKKTMLKKYGIEHAAQNSKIFTKIIKSGYKQKPVVTPSGKIIYLQGYEPQIYEQLLKEYKEDEIKHKAIDMPEIWYNTKDNTKHRYFPDFFVPKDNLIIEVKSTYYYEKDLNKNLLKQQSVLAAGYNFKFVILSKDVLIF